MVVRPSACRRRVKNSFGGGAAFFSIDCTLGHLADDQQMLCEGCVEERGLLRLERWPADEEVPAYARLRPGLAACLTKLERCGRR